MYQSIVRNKIKRERGNFVHKKYFETLTEGQNWASDLAFRIVDSGFWQDHELVMEHKELEK